MIIILYIVLIYNNISTSLNDFNQKEEFLCFSNKVHLCYLSWQCCFAMLLLNFLCAPNQILSVSLMCAVYNRCCRPVVCREILFSSFMLWSEPTEARHDKWKQLKTKSSENESNVYQKFAENSLGCLINLPYG